MHLGTLSRGCQEPPTLFHTTRALGRRQSVNNLGLNLPVIWHFQVRQEASSLQPLRCFSKISRRAVAQDTPLVRTLMARRPPGMELNTRSAHRLNWLL